MTPLEEIGFGPRQTSEEDSESGQSASTDTRCPFFATHPFHLSRYQMKKLSDVEYKLTFSYEDDAHLDKQIYDLLREIDEEADCRNCFVETNAREQGTGRSW